MEKEQLGRPERKDIHHLARQTKSLYISQFSLLFMFIICLCLIVAVVMASRKPQSIAVVDLSTGKSFGTTTQSYTSDILTINLVYYSKLFCESYYNADHAEIEQARKAAVELMHPTFINKMRITTDFYHDSYVKNVKAHLSNAAFDWITVPNVTIRNDPRYTVFCQFRRIQRINGKTIETQHNVTLHWIRYTNIDPMKKATPLFVLDFNDNEIDSPEVKKQLELLTRK